MKNINLSNKQDLQVFRTELDAALKQVGDKLGLKLSAGSIRYQHDGTSAEVKLKALKVFEGGVVITKERKALEEIAKFREWLNPFVHEGKTISTPKGPMTLTGYNSRARRFPYMAETTDGRKFKLSEQHIR